MKDRNYLLIRVVLYGSNAMICVCVFYFPFDNKLAGILVGTVVATALFYKRIKSAVSSFFDMESEVIYLGFNVKRQLPYFVLWAILIYVYYQSNKALTYWFLALFFLLSGIEGGLRFIIFDFSTGKVAGLFGDSVQDAGKLSVVREQHDKSDKIKVTDNGGFFSLDKNNFTVDQWDRLLNCLNRMRK